MLKASLIKDLGDLRLEAELNADVGETLVLVGESGAGKTTLLRLLAGLLQPDAGRLELDGHTYIDTERNLFVPAHEREVGYVFQDYALFPHESVFDNVAFGLRAQRRPRAEIEQRTQAMLERIGIADLARARPSQISGGQQQRTALARALVLEPKLLLLDEPLSALDLQTRRQVRGELRALVDALRGATLFVTHSPFEAMAFGERIAVIESGQITQLGSREDLLRHPRSRYVAELMGLNFFQGRVVSTTADGLATVQTEHGTLNVLDVRTNDEIFIAVDPRAITLHLDPPRATAQNVIQGTIAELVPEPPYGERVRVVLDSEPTLVVDITAHSAESMRLQPGVPVFASFKAYAGRPYR